MNGEYQVRIETTIDRETAERLQRYCTVHGIKRREAMRVAIALLLAQRRVSSDPPKLDPDAPL